MNAPEISTVTAQDLANPYITGETLERTAWARPDLWWNIMGHPNCPAELATQLRQRLAPVPDLSSRATPRPADPAVEQMAAGAKQLAAGARDFLSQRVIPAATSTARSVQQAVSQQTSTGSSPDVWRGRALVAVPALAFVAILSLFLPAVTASVYGFSRTANYFTEGTGGEGVFLLVVLLTVIGSAMAALLTHARWARIVTGVAGIVVGGFGAVDGFGTAANVSNLSYASVGVGMVLLAAASTALVVAAALLLWRSKTREGLAA